jgi:hypothetical protein
LQEDTSHSFDENDHSVADLKAKIAMKKTQLAPLIKGEIINITIFI